MIEHQEVHPEPSPGGWDDVPLAPEHVDRFVTRAVTAPVIKDADIRSYNPETDQLPAGCPDYWAGYGTGILFPWVGTDGTTRWHFRPDNPPTGTDGRAKKYVAPAGDDAPSFGVVVPVTADTHTVLIVEGDIQPYAVASCAPAGYAIYKIPGCRGWSKDGVPTAGLEVVDGQDVVVILDADADKNLDVYTAGIKLKDACDLEGAAGVKFTRLAASGTSGIDDVLGKKAADKRATYLTRLIEGAKTKPADAKPKAKRGGGAAERPAVRELPTDRTRIVVNNDRYTVINEITDALKARWDGTELFNHGGAISRASGHKLKPLGQGDFLNTLQEGCVTVFLRVTREGDIEYDYSWPDDKSIRAAMDRAGEYTELDEVRRSPFIRPDGTVCQAPGYDPATKTLLVLDAGTENVTIPDQPTRAQVQAAVDLLLDDWLGDFIDAMPTSADAANMLALLITPFIRGMVERVPVGVVNGLQPGVGKGYLADGVAILATGEAARPLPYTTDDDEQRKVITGVFRDGQTLMIFDECHVLEGRTFARAVTGSTYSDRILGVSQMVEFPNRVTWMTLGNNVRVEGDMFRRCFEIALRPGGRDPEQRKTDTFRHPDFQGWTLEHRAELVAAVLTLIRAWFTAGKPKPSRGVSFGSFEAWERICGGILEHAGIGGFLTNREKFLSDSSFERAYWAAHITWLHQTFGEEEFTTSQVRKKIMEDREGAETPPKLSDVTDPDYSRDLGRAYHSQVDRYYGDYRLIKTGTGHGNVAKWAIEVFRSSDGDPGGGGGPSGSDHPAGPASDLTPQEPSPSQGLTVAGGMTGGPTGGLGDLPVSGVQVGGGVGATQAGQGSADVIDDDGAIVGNGVHASEAIPPSPQSPHPPTPSGTGGIGGIPPATCTGENTHTFAPAYEARVFSRKSAAVGLPPIPPLPPGATVAFDIETAGVEELWTRGSDFVRLSGYSADGGEVHLTTNADELTAVLRGAGRIVGHNVLGFDLLALARYHGLDIHQLVADDRIVDTYILARLADPPPARERKNYSLDAVGQRLVGAAKGGDLGAMARKHGGFDAIPLDDPDYVAYLKQDVRLAAQLDQALPMTDYARREHQVAAIAAQISLNGFRVDTELLAERLEAGRARKAHLLGVVADKYGLPTTRKDGKPSASPQGTEEGRAAIKRAFEAAGAPHMPKTEAGAWQIGKEGMAKMTEVYGHIRPVAELIDVVQSLNGVRTVYETITDHLAGDRVHPMIDMRQASGRWSLTQPGLTVMGKRGERYMEREVFLPEPGEVLISADLSQIDARAIAVHSQDPRYLALFAPGIDAHEEVAQMVWGNKSRRDEAKAIGHGWNYGMGISSLVRNAKVSEQVAHQFDTTMKEQFPFLVEWRDGVREQAKAGMLLDNGFGRLMRPDPERAWTQGPALMGQGTARDLMMAGLLRLPAEILPMLRAVVHDEIVLSVPISEADELERAVLEALTFTWAPPGKSIPVTVTAGLGKRRGHSWGHVYAKEASDVRPAA